MSATLLKLERFDRPLLPPGEASEQEVRIQQARAQGYSEGYAAGLAASASKAGERDRLLAAAASAIEAAAASAPQRVKEEATGAARTIIEALFPALSRAGFAVEAARIFDDAAKGGDAARLEILAPQEHASALDAALKAAGGGAVISVKADPALAGAAASATWAGGGIEVDLDRAARECLDALDRAIGKVSNGKMS